MQVTDILMSVHLSSVADHFTYGLTNVREVLKIIITPAADSPWMAPTVFVTKELGRITHLYKLRIEH